MTTTNTKTMTASDYYDAALACCKGRYQEDVVRGYEDVSGASLRGKAKKWGARYADSRSSLFSRMDSAGICYDIFPAKNGKHEIIWGHWAVDAAGKAERLLAGNARRELIARIAEAAFGSPQERAAITRKLSRLARGEE